MKKVANIINNLPIRVKIGGFELGRFSLPFLFV